MHVFPVTYDKYLCIAKILMSMNTWFLANINMIYNVVLCSWAFVWFFVFSQTHKSLFALIKDQSTHHRRSIHHLVWFDMFWKLGQCQQKYNALKINLYYHQILKIISLTSREQYIGHCAGFWRQFQNAYYNYISIAYQIAVRANNSIQKCWLLYQYSWIYRIHICP